jgi:hypothetical protein
MLRFRNLRDLVRFRKRYLFEQSLIDREGPEITDLNWRIQNYIMRYTHIPATLRNSSVSARRFRSRYVWGEGPEELTGMEKSDRRKL